MHCLPTLEGAAGGDGNAVIVVSREQAPRIMEHRSDVADTVERLKQKYLERRKQLPLSEDITPGSSDEAGGELVLDHTCTRPRKELQSYSKALNALFKAVTKHPQQFGSGHSPHGSYEDLSGGLTAAAHQDSQVVFTETDVTLPSCLDGSPGSHESETIGKLRRAHQVPDLCRSSSLVQVKVYQEMMTIYEQLKAERQSQQQWERELHERERRLKQHEEAFAKLSGLEEMVHSCILAVEELQELLQERSKENKRLKSSFESIKELNDNMKKQLNEISEQNKKLESQSKRVQARLENLQGSSSPTQLRLLALLLDWVLDGQTFCKVAGDKDKGVGHCLPQEVALSERCLKVLPLLADQLYHTPSSESDLQLSLLRFIHWALRYMDNSGQHVVLSATLRRIGEEVMKTAAQSALLQSEDADLPRSCSGAAGTLRNWHLYRSRCPHTRILSTLIILRTVTQGSRAPSLFFSTDLFSALDSLHSELISEESRGLFIHYGGVGVLLRVLQASRGGLHRPIHLLMQLTEQSSYLNRFLEVCSCEEFFRTASQLLKHPRLELPLLEKLSMLLQKLSGIRKNRRLFELSSLHHQIQELYHKTNHTHTFLSLNLRSVLLNLK
ncbi:hypothetical protein INR49_025133 [Caranx melampygus]|nr:hypothetical protein INR49_025133 [Caranx melampygus]